MAICLRPAIVSLVLAIPLAFGQAPAVTPAAPPAAPAAAPAAAPVAPAVAAAVPVAPPVADGVNLLSERLASGPEAEEWLHTLTCRAGGVPPSLRVTLNRLNEASASAGTQMRVGAEDLATGTIRVRVALQDKASGAYAVTVEVGPAGPTILGQTLRLEAGKDLKAVTALQALPASATFRHGINLGSVGGCILSAYVMPGRAPSRPTASAMPPPGDPAAQTLEVFRKWVRGVKSGDLEQFAAGVPAGEWGRLTPEQRLQRLQEYQQSFGTVLGADFDPDQFQVEYSGSSISGRLTIRYGDKQLPALSVRYLGGAWVIFEP